ncbi:hypothetical protein O0L34_g11081 [Tuta absoluta]|nr:hypothetical protein O0L34_g11081 [Tuta absoluta]
MHCIAGVSIPTTPIAVVVVAGVRRRRRRRFSAQYIALLAGGNWHSEYRATAKWTLVFGSRVMAARDKRSQAGDKANSCSVRIYDTVNPPLDQHIPTYVQLRRNTRVTARHYTHLARLSEVASSMYFNEIIACA